MILSSVLITWEVRETGRKFSGDDLTQPLWIGTTKASFMMDGTLPEMRNFLKSISRGSARLLLHFLSRIDGTPSGPAEELVLSLSKDSIISSLLKKMLFSCSEASL